MGYDTRCASICDALGYVAEQDFSCLFNGVDVDLVWLHGDPQPTEQQIADYANDVTNLPNGQTFTQWQQEHGGDVAQTFRRKAKEALDRVQAEQEGLLRALALVVLDEINTLRAEHSLAARTPTQLRNAIKAKITSGDADT